MSKELEELKVVMYGTDKQRTIGEVDQAYENVKKALLRLSLLEELFVKMNLEFEIEMGDDSWGVSQDFGTYVGGDNSTFEELYVTDDETVMLISKLKGGEIETMYEDMTGEMGNIHDKEEE